MKNVTKRRGIVSLIMLFCISILLIFPACLDTEEEAIKLDAPVVVLIDDTATWEGNEKAEKFEVSLNGILSYLENSVTSKKLEHGQTFKIRALGDGDSYTNSDWSNAVTYTKQPDQDATFTVTWKNGEAILETDVGVEQGATPVYNGALPTKAATAQYTYTFKGWTPAVAPVTQDVTYFAEFDQIVNRYTVTFYDESGTNVLDSVTVDYGESVEYSKSTPVKNATEGHTYIFDKWVTTQGGSIAATLDAVTGDQAVYASFKDFVRKVSVYVISNNTDYGTVSVSVLENVPYGCTITTNKNKVTVNGQTVTANASDKTAQYTYVFVDWSADATVGNDTVIMANFSRRRNTYTVTWKNGDSVLELDEDVSYGTTPTYNGVQPTKAAEGKDAYVFSGWSPAVTAVTEDVTYVAQFTTTENKHIVTFYDDNSTTILGVAVVDDGATAVYPNVLPTKQETEQYTYTFEKWVTEANGSTEAQLTNITENKEVYAKYTQSLREYSVRFVDWDGSLLSEQKVAYGQSAEAPFAERDEYRFTSWSCPFDNITGETTITAQYVQQFVVKFLAYDNSIIEIQHVDWGMSATAPQHPPRVNYRENGWSRDFIKVCEHLEVKALYVRQYKVQFVAPDGSTVLQEDWVDEKTSATPPKTEPLEGYTFKGWDKEYDCIEADVVITAVYERITCIVTFVLPDGTTIEENVDYGFAPIAPNVPAFHYYMEKEILKVKGFSGWSCNVQETIITEDTTIEAVYEEEYTQPIIFMVIDKDDINVYVFGGKGVILKGIELSFAYTVDTSDGNIVVTGVEKDSASILDDSRYQYEFNNTEKSFVFAWSDSAGQKVEFCNKALTIHLHPNGALINTQTIQHISATAVIMITQNSVNSLQRITPNVVYFVK